VAIGFWKGDGERGARSLEAGRRAWDYITKYKE